MIAILALGIGANTAVFSVVDAVLLRPPLFERPERLVQVKEFALERSRWFRASEYPLLEERDDLFEAVAAHNRNLVTLTGGPGPDQVFSVGSSAGLMSLLGVRAHLGRTVLESDGALNAPNVATISHRLWHRRFQADPEIVGQSMMISEELFTIVGVMPPEFEFPVANVDLWVPLRLTAESGPFPGVIARLADGVTIGEVQSALGVVTDQLRELDPKRNADLNVVATQWRQELEPQYERTMVLILGAVAFVLLIACANVAGLLLGRAVKREREIAVRAALGAGLWRVARGLMAESLALAVLGSAGGVLMAHLVLRWAAAQLAVLPITVPHLQHVELNPRALLASVASCLLVAGLCSLAPILFAYRTDTQGVLRSGHRSGSKGSGSLFSFLIASQAAFAFLLLVGSGLMVQSVIRLQQADKGFRTEQVLTLRVPVGSMNGGPPSDKVTPEQIRAHYQELVERIEALPGVREAAITSNLPLSGIRMTIADRGPDGKRVGYSLRSVSRNYFSVMGIRLRAGRLFTEADGPDVATVGIVNEHMARQLYPDRDPIGQLLNPANPKNPVRIVGVAENSWQGHYDRELEAEAYMPYRQLMRWSFASTIVVRTVNEPLTLAETLRKEVWAADPDQPILKVETMDTVVANSIWRPRFSAWLFSILGALALLLAALGVYAIVSYTSSMRLREVGIRIAVGATPGNVVGLILRDATTPLAVGLVAGGAAAFFLSDFIATLLFETQGSDPVAYAGAAAILLGVGVLAGIRPALSAAAAKPLTVLGAE